MMKKNYDLIVFDWDGTLINTIDWIINCLQQSAVMAGYSAPSEEAARNTIGLSLQNAMQTLFPGVDEEISVQLVNNYSTIFFSRPLSRDDLFAGVFDMLNELKADGYQLAIATGKCRNGLQKALTQTETEDLFCITRCADETASKPSPIMLEEIMADMGVPAERTLMIGDSIHDIQMAKNAKVDVIGVCCGAHDSEILTSVNPKTCLSQTTDIMKILRG